MMEVCIVVVTRCRCDRSLARLCGFWDETWACGFGDTLVLTTSQGTTLVSKEEGAMVSRIPCSAAQKVAVERGVETAIKTNHGLHLCIKQSVT